MSDDIGASVNGAGEGVTVQEFKITKEFLECTFNKQVESFEISPGTNPGDNYMSVIHAVKVVFKDDPKTCHYLIKCYPNHPGRRQFLDQMEIFEKELFMYSEFFPTIQKIADDSNVSEGIAKLSVPPFHGGNVASAPTKKYKDSQWANENFIIMTDLRTQNFTMADRITGLDLDHTILVIKEMAKLHCLGWAVREKEGLKLLSEKFKVLRDDIGSRLDMAKDFQGMMTQLSGNTLNVVKEALSEDHPVYISLKTFLEGDMMGIMQKFMGPHDIDEDTFENMLRVKPPNDAKYNKEPWLTTTHGDGWVNNFLFRYDQTQESKKLVEMMFVDFQGSKETCPTVDLAYLLNTSLRAKLRIPNKEKLLKAYHDMFIHCCKELKVEPYPGFSMESLKRRYTRAEIFGFAMAMPLLSIVLKPKEESTDLDKDGKDKSMADVFTTVIGGSENNTGFKDEIVATVLDMHKNGLI